MLSTEQSACDPLCDGRSVFASLSRSSSLSLPILVRNVSAFCVEATCVYTLHNNSKAVVRLQGCKRYFQASISI